MQCMHFTAKRLAAPESRGHQGLVDISIACPGSWMTEHHCPEIGLQKSLSTTFDCMV
jgi:hypothetical protein